MCLWASVCPVSARRRQLVHRIGVSRNLIANGQRRRSGSAISRCVCLYSCSGRLTEGPTVRASSRLRAHLYEPVFHYGLSLSKGQQCCPFSSDMSCRMDFLATYRSRKEKLLMSESLSESWHLSFWNLVRVTEVLNK